MIKDKGKVFFLVLLIFFGMASVFGTTLLENMQHYFLESSLEATEGSNEGEVFGTSGIAAEAGFTAPSEAFLFAAQTLPYETNFQDLANWTFLNPDANKWVFGTAAGTAGQQALYISNDDGVTNGYNTGGSSVAHAYVELAIPANAVEGELFFNWRGEGEYFSDYMNVWLVPMDYVLTPGSTINAGGQNVQIGGQFIERAEYVNLTELLELTPFAGQTIRLVFQWQNDGSVGTQPAAAISKLRFKVNECLSVKSFNLCEGQDYIGLHWEPRANEDAWQIAIETTDLAEPTNILEVYETQYNATDLLENSTYYVYLRSACENGGYGSWVKRKVRTSKNTMIEAAPFCAGVEGLIFPNVSGPGGRDGDYYGRIGCLAFTPNPVWYFIRVATAGDLIFNISQNTAFDDAGNAIGDQLDTDFIAFGPFTDLGQACSETNLGPCPDGVSCPSNKPDSTPYPIGNIVDCGFNFENATNPMETLRIYDAQPGQIYAILITNFKGDPGFIKLIQKNSEEEGAGTTDCSFLCEVDLGGDQIVCDREEVQLRASIPSNGAVEPLTYAWYKNGVLLDAATYNTDRITVTDTGVYKVVVGKDFCDSDPTDEVTITFATSFKGTVASELTVCDEQNNGQGVFDLNVFVQQTLGQVANANEYDCLVYASEADRNRNRNPIDVTVPYVSEAGTLYLKIVRKDSKGCDVEASVVLQLKTTLLPTVAFDYKAPICIQNGALLLPVLADGFTNGGLFAYRKKGNVKDPFENTNTTGALALNKQTGAIDVSASEAGTYEVFYKYEIPAAFCGVDQVFQTTITLHDAFEISYEGGCFEGAYQLKVVDVNGTTDLTQATYKWEGPKGFEATTSTIAAEEIGTYKVVFTTKEGCSQELTLDLENVNCQIAKGISPNGDGINDRFDLSQFLVKKLTIFNRYGKEVYHYGAGYTNQWSGQDNNKSILPAATYYYMIELERETKTGWIHLSY